MNRNGSFIFVQSVRPGCLADLEIERHLTMERRDVCPVVHVFSALEVGDDFRMVAGRLPMRKVSDACARVVARDGSLSPYDRNRLVGPDVLCYKLLPTNKA